MFENVNQSAEMIDSLRDIVRNPMGFILFSGKNGTGKTFAAQALMDEICNANGIFDSDDSLFISQTQLNLKWQKQLKEWGETLYLLHQIVATKVLVLDDIGTRTPTEAFMDFLYAIVDTRYERRHGCSTILTTNLNSKDMRSRFGDAFVSRVGSGRIFRFEGDDRRITQF